ncbi:MAG: ADP-ribosylation factor-like protein [Candidatus Hodarchaeales archaeon]|jgi:GTPase SAR1 family protein
MSGAAVQKILFMGLGASGKSSIRSIVFEGKSLTDVKDYNATINYTRSTKNIIDSAFQIFDCGGQESFISVFVGEQAEFIFSGVSILIWVVDVSNFDAVSTSKFYFDHAVTRLAEFSPDAVIFCLFHKMDLLLPDMREQVSEKMISFFTPEKDIETIYRPTSIYDQSVFSVVGEMIQILIRKNVKAKTVTEAIQEFVKQNVELSGIAIYSEEGLPVVEEGDLADKIILPANLLLTNYDRLSDEFGEDNFKTTLETNDYMFVFQQMKSKLLLSGIARKVSPLQYVMVKMEQLAEILSDLL